MQVEWKDELNIGVLEIDVQHKILFEKFNGFLSAYDSQTDPEEVLRLFWFLEAYAVTHFKDEEKVMQRIFFPDYLLHRKKHQEFVDRINDLKERLKNEGLTQNVISTMTAFITAWLVEHISTMDRAIGEFATRSNRSL